MQGSRAGWCAGLIAAAMLAGCKPHGASNATNTAAAPPPSPAPAAAPVPPAPAPAQAWTPSTPAPNISVSLAPAPTQAGDIAGGHDVAFLERFQGASIIGYVSHPYDRLSFYDSTGNDQDADRRAVEGAVTRVVYRIPTGHSALEVFRNYENLVEAAGMARTSEIPCTPSYSNLLAEIFNQIAFGQLNGVFQLNATAEQPWCYFTAQAVANGQPLTLGVLVAEKHGVLSATASDGSPMTYQPGEVVALVDLVAAKPVQNQMVVVKAADMADALAAKGFVDLYGVYFDTDRTEVKPQSKATLDEVATLMKIDRSLRLEVSGHTDNTGSAQHNLTLSQGRADAVVQALVSQYGIDRSRLVAKGYGDTKPVASNADEAGKAKNRRVELRKI